MQQALLVPPPISVTPLSYRPAEAAKALGISERLLWTWTKEQKVPHVRIGNVVLYPVVELNRWLRDNTTTLAADGLGGTGPYSTVVDVKG